MTYFLFYYVGSRSLANRQLLFCNPRGGPWILLDHRKQESDPQSFLRIFIASIQGSKLSYSNHIVPLTTYSMIISDNIEYCQSTYGCFYEGSNRAILHRKPSHVFSRAPRTIISNVCLTCWLYILGQYESDFSVTLNKSHSFIIFEFYICVMFVFVMRFASTNLINCTASMFNLA